MKALLYITFLAGAIFSGAAAQQQARIDVIDFFGTQGIDVAQVRKALPIHVGSTFPLDDAHLQELKEQVTQAVAKVTGHDPTNRALVCCTAKGGWMYYVGLEGKSYRPFTYNAAPTGSITLPEDGMDTYKRAMDALAHAVQNDGAEDDSKGYALSSDPAEHAAELAMRDYAVHHEELVRKVLATSGDKASREAASEILGYANESQGQIDALVAASRDADAGVRNNAIRALGVLATSSQAVAAKIPADNFVAMLNSGTWTDRNKGGFLLQELTVSRDPKVLQEIDDGARDSLIEMAHWQDAGHAGEYRVILGRIAGIEEKKLQKIAWEDNAPVEAIIAALPARHN